MSIVGISKWRKMQDVLVRLRFPVHSWCAPSEDPSDYLCSFGCQLGIQAIECMGHPTLQGKEAPKIFGQKEWQKSE